MSRVGRTVGSGILSRFLGGLRFPQAFALLGGLFVLDFFLIDPIPFLDEMVLAVLTLMAPIGGAVALNRGSADDDKVEVEFTDTRFENPANEIENDSPGSPSFDNENDSTSFDTE